MSTSNAASKKAKFSPQVYSNKIAEEFYIRCDKHGTLWFYKEETGLWSNNGEKLIERELRDGYLKPEHISNYYVREVISDIKSRSRKEKVFPPPPRYLIPFKNGVYDLKTREFSAFDPKYNFTSHLAANYNPDTSGCPLIDKIFQEVVKPENLSDLYELAAYCLLPAYPNQEIYFLLGSGRNGKSTYTDILNRLMGKENISAVSLHDLQANRFSGAELHGKFANISSELRYNDLINTDHIKKLSGGDLIQAERKFQQPFTFENFAKLIFVANDLPRTMDKTLAFFRRVRIIRFPNVFEGEKEDKMLKDKITDEELGGLSFKCIQMLQDMMKRNFTFNNQKSTKEIAEEYEKISNPIDTFIEQSCKLDVNGFIAKEEFKNKLDGWLNSTGQRIRIPKEIAIYMKDKGIDDQKRTLSGDIRKNAWVGIRWKD